MPCEAVYVHKIACVGEWVDLENPTLSTDIQCYSCGCKDHYTAGVSCMKDAQKVWMCANPLCLTMVKESVPVATSIQADSRRALEWPLFCEINAIGDKKHDITFEKINQDRGRINVMRDFVKNPDGFIFMIGDRGGGKTYASLGMCEMFTRTSSSCRYYTGRDLFDAWIKWTQHEPFSDLLNRLVNVDFLVIDDFAVSEPSTKFMEFFTQLIDKRCDWSRKGTVVTSNLKFDELSEVCGETLIERFKHGTIFHFNQGSRRQFKQPKR